MTNSDMEMEMEMEFLFIFKKGGKVIKKKVIKNTFSVICVSIVEMCCVVCVYSVFVLCFVCVCVCVVWFGWVYTVPHQTKPNHTEHIHKK